MCVVIHLHSTRLLESAGCWKHPVLPGEMLKSALCWLNCVTSMLRTLLKGVSLVFNLFYLWAVINYSLAPLQIFFFLNVFNRGAIVCFVFIFFMWIATAPHSSLNAQPQTQELFHRNKSQRKTNNSSNKKMCCCWWWFSKFYVKPWPPAASTFHIFSPQR